MLAAIVTRANAATPPPLEEPNSPPIAFLEDVEKLSDFHTWGKVPFVHPDYEYINKCAYFDYQRDKSLYPHQQNTAEAQSGKKEESKSDTQSVPTRRDRGRTMSCVQE